MQVTQLNIPTLSATVLALSSLAVAGWQRARSSPPGQPPIAGTPLTHVVEPCTSVAPGDVRTISGLVANGGTESLYTVPTNKWLMVTDIQARISNPMQAYASVGVNSLLIPLTVTYPTGTSTLGVDWEPASWHSAVGMPVAPGGNVTITAISGGGGTYSVYVTVVGYLVDA